MKKFTAIMLAISLLLTGTWTEKNTSAESEPSLMLDAFLALEAEFDYYEVMGSATFSEEKLSKEQLEKVAQYLLEKAQAEQVTLSHVEEKDGSYVTLVYDGRVLKDSFFRLILQSKVYGELEDTTVAVSVTETNDYENFYKAEELLNWIFSDFKEKPLRNTCFQGYKNGKLKNKFLSMVNQVFLKTDAILVESASEENQSFQTAYGYASGLPDFITVGHQKMNLHVAAYYDETQDRTYFCIGSPIISTDY